MTLETEQKDKEQVRKPQKRNYKREENNKEENKRGRKIHLIVTANSYELAEVFKEEVELVAYIWVPTNEFILLGSYNKFKKRYMEYYKEMNFDKYGKRRA